MAGRGTPDTARPVRARPWTRFVLPTYVFAVMAYTLVPIAVMIVYTFNKAPNQRLTFSWHGFTTEWYSKLFQVQDLTQALFHSLEVAVISSIIATALGTPAAMALARRKFRGRGLIDLVVVTNLTAPTVVVFSAFLLSFALSIDDYIITSFVAGQTLTFPLWVAGAVKVGIPPQVFVMGTLIFVSGVLIALASLVLQRWGDHGDTVRT
jgi:ABC-type spermidine/putrescine transport system permease subunit II